MPISLHVVSELATKVTKSVKFLFVMLMVSILGIIVWLPFIC